MRAPESGISNIGDFPDIAASILERLRARRPRIHCITNAVAQNLTANVLLAVGALPSMTISRDEVGAFAGSADALMVNLGTFDSERRDAVRLALDAVAQTGRPWMLDPVLIDRSPQRAGFAHALLADSPAAVRMNAAEFAVLAGGKSPSAFAVATGSVAAITAQIDEITDGTRTTRIGNGHPLMAQVTAMGCAASALVAASQSVEEDRQQAVSAAILLLGAAGDIAGEAANGPGSFGVHILDALYNLDRTQLRQRAKVMS